MIAHVRIRENGNLLGGCNCIIDCTSFALITQTASQNIPGILVFHRFLRIDARTLFNLFDKSYGSVKFHAITSILNL